MKAGFYKKFSICSFFSTLGDQFTLYAIPLIVFKLTQSIALSGLTFAIEWIPRVLSLPVAGVFCDKISSKKIFMISEFSRMLLLILIFLSLSIFQDIFNLLIFFIALLSIFNAFSFVSLDSAISKYFSITDLKKAQSIMQSSNQINSILGPAIAGVCVSFFQMNIIFLFGAFFYFFSLLFFILNKNYFSSLDNFPIRSSDNIFISIFKDNLKAGGIIFNNIQLIYFLIFSTLINVIYGMILALLVPIISLSLKLPLYYLSFFSIFAGFFCVFTLISINSFLNKIDLQILGCYSLFSIAISAIFFGYLNNLYFMIFAFSILITSISVFNIFIRSERSRLIPSENLGKCTGLIVMISQLSLPLSGFFIYQFSNKIPPISLLNIINTPVSILIIILTLFYFLKLIKTNNLTKVV
ncbi:MFS transporter [Fluviispira multicolorata]|uniref:MFS transporter n=1 Tax=Fluviispira multicolorata TaxID=2654512 RepID=A0A833N4K2_9BACT|nr:MFS transporter [Fluviispira multicolorata]KAB8032106.1 MFS transporter [Fluviispira multicolorata]